MQIEKATLGRINERSIPTSPLKLQPLSQFEQLDGPEAAEFEEALTKPIGFQYNDGVVTDMVSLESDPYWSVNIKRSILSVFNINLKPQSNTIKGSRFAATLGHLHAIPSDSDNGAEYTVLEVHSSSITLPVLSNNKLISTDTCRKVSEASARLSTSFSLFQPETPCHKQCHQPTLASSTSPSHGTTRTARIDLFISIASPRMPSTAMLIATRKESAPGRRPETTTKTR